MSSIIQLVDTTLEGSASGPEFPTRPSEDLEHARILAAVNAKLFGQRPLQIAHYQIERLLGAGGMGEVFLARDQALGRLVALKILRSDIGGDVSTERLRNEAQTLARLSHPNVVQVHEFDQQDGRAHVVMEYVAGPTLTSWLARERRSRREILAAFRSAGEGLAAAHEVGVIHRDFKPDNVIVGDDGRIRVVDFGLAHAGESLERDRAGTPRYMAPEQLAGHTIDARADQYAFCVALHEALWNALPSPGPRPPGAGPGWLWRCIRKGLAQEPEQRWPDMLSLLAALDDRRRRAHALGLGLACVGGLALGFLALDRADACDDAGAEFDELWSRATAEQLAGDFASIDAVHGPAAAERLIAGLDAWGAQWRDARIRNCRARAQGFSQLLATRRDACLDDSLAQVREHVRASLEADARTIAFAWTLVDGLPRLSACEDDDSLRAADTSGLVDESRRTQLEQLRQTLHESAAERLAGHPERNFEPLALARADAEQLADPRVLAELLAEQAATEFMAGSPQRGLELLELAARKAYVAGDDRLVSRLWGELSMHAVSEFDDADRAQRWLDQARDAWARTDPSQQDQEMRASLAFASGAVALQRGQLDEAAHELDRARADAGPRLRAFVLDRQALLAEQHGEFDRALVLREQALAASEAALGPLHPRTLRFSIALAGALVESDPKQTRERLQRVFEAAEVLDNVSLRDLADARMISCGAEHALQDDEAALAAARAAESLFAQLGPEAALDRGLAQNAIGTIETTRENFEAAAAAYERALELLEARLGQNDELVVEVRNNSVTVLLELGRLDEARARFERTRALGPEIGPAWTIASLGLAEIELRDAAPERARAVLETLKFDDARTIDRLIGRMLSALSGLRLGWPNPDPGLTHDIENADPSDREWLLGIAENLNMNEAERTSLGLLDNPPPTGQ